MKILMNCLLASLCLSATFASGQTVGRAKAISTAAFSLGVDRGTENLRVLGDDPHPAVFHLVTSWIPGEENKGYIRYRMDVRGQSVGLKEAPKYIDRLHKCQYTLNVYDSGTFVLRRINLVFMEEIADSGDVVQMSTNDLSQMNLAEYKSFLGGSWQMAWVCN